MAGQTILLNALIVSAAPPLSPLLAPVPTGRRIPGNKGIWVGITCELVEFTLMFLVYFIARAHYPEDFAQGAALLSKTAGTLNTVVMVSSSFLVACAVAAMRAGQVRRSMGCMLGALLVALAYPLTKYFEVTWNLAHGINGGSGIFITVYYYLTFNHLVHASWGILGMGWVLVRMALQGYTPEDSSGLEALASYWHATDIIWLIIFPLFYVLA
jgi:cytochrome c oxidase subunit 3